MNGNDKKTKTYSNFLYTKLIKSKNLTIKPLYTLQLITVFKMDLKNSRFFRRRTVYNSFCYF